MSQEKVAQQAIFAARVCVCEGVCWGRGLKCLYIYSLVDFTKKK